MSLIQEALRRQREEGSTGPSPQTPASAPAPAAPTAPGTPVGGGARPPPLPAPIAASGPSESTVESESAQHEDAHAKGHGRSVLSIVGIVALILILGALGTGLIYFAYNQWSKSKSATAVARVEQPAATQPAATAGQPAASVADPATGANATAVPPSSPAATSPDSTVTAAGQPVGGVAAVGAGAAAASGETSPQAGAVTGDGSPAWPFLKVTGVVGKGLRGAATINGRIVAVGETIDGVEVTAIGEFGAKLEYEGETRFAKVGATVE